MQFFTSLLLSGALSLYQMLFNKKSITGISLDAAGLVALADLSSVSERTALTGSASALDILFLAPGIHRQQDASNVNGGELPTAGSMTNGYVFRIENQATVRYLQNIGEPGYLVTVCVAQKYIESLALVFSPLAMLYGLGIALTIISLGVLGSIRDYWGVGVLLMLVLSRFLNMIVIKRRSRMGWKGSPEPGVMGDVLVLISQDRWIRMKGAVDDLKAVTSGQWLRDQTRIEGFASATATLLVYVAAALASNAATVGSLVIAILLLVSVALLGLCNSLTKDLHMFGRRVYTVGRPKAYSRRLDMVEELVTETGRSDWAISLGLILSS